MIETQAAARVALRLIFKESIRLRNDFKGELCRSQKVGYPKESDIPGSDRKGSFYSTYF